MPTFRLPFLVATASVLVSAQSNYSKIVLTNDDGWAVANIRATRDSLVSSGYDVILSCPAINKSGTGSSTATPTPLAQPCEFDTCPTGSPAVGNNASDTRLNYVNAYPADSVAYGIKTLAPRYFDGGRPDFVVSGPNVGSNVGSTVQISGTVGAACEASKEGIPSAGFSGPSGSQVSYTTLTSSPTSTSTLTALLYANLTTIFTNALLSSTPEGSAILPPNVTLNVNFPSYSSQCSSPEDFDWILSRILEDEDATDVDTCGSTHLPTESDVIATDGGCFIAVSVYNATTKADVGADTQGYVLNTLGDFLSCLP